jgi:hypothetical protein
VLTLPPRQRVGITFGVVILMGLHAALVASAHTVSGLQARIWLGAYVGALSAFMGAVASGVAWHRLGGMKGARPHHVFVSAWWLAGISASAGMLLAFLSDRTSTGLERAVGTAFLGALLGSMVGVRQEPVMLTRWAEKDVALGLKPLSPAATRRAISVAALVASGAFGLVHPLVRFPLSVPKEPGEVFVYASVAVAMTAVLLPFAGGRMMRAFRHSGVTTKGALDRRGSLLMFALAVAGAGVWLLVAPPRQLEEWLVFRGLVGALVGSAGAAWGASRAT